MESSPETNARNIPNGFRSSLKVLRDRQRLSVSATKQIVDDVRDDEHNINPRLPHAALTNSATLGATTEMVGKANRRNPGVVDYSIPTGVAGITQLSTMNAGTAMVTSEAVLPSQEHLSLEKLCARFHRVERALLLMPEFRNVYNPNPDECGDAGLAHEPEAEESPSKDYMINEFYDDLYEEPRDERPLLHTTCPVFDIAHNDSFIEDKLADLEQQMALLTASMEKLACHGVLSSETPLGQKLSNSLSEVVSSQIQAAVASFEARLDGIDSQLASNRLHLDKHSKHIGTLFDKHSRHIATLFTHCATFKKDLDDGRVVWGHRQRDAT